ncbi:MAG: hypothetical protein N2035_10400 [Chthoniobacterales bacterium]|nr:hypothetical protein [Chthoniobacterales bacterium]
MNSLLDTQVFLRVLAVPSHFPPATRHTIQKPDYTAFVSAPTGVKFATKCALGKLEARIKRARGINACGLNSQKIHARSC